MLYHSTRSSQKKVSSKEAILQGLCPDGGLYVSDDIFNAGLDMKSLMELDYEQIVYEVFHALLDDYSADELKDCISKAYRGKFETEDLTPVSQIGDRYLLELYHGPTAAFKDMALCMLPQLMSKALKDEKVMILTATSGDTGKAALAGFRDAENIGITVFFPDGGVSDIQYLQMATAEGSNVNVAAVKGNFDDCQTGVKQIFARCSDTIRKDRRISLSSANSINVGRLVPQIVYYIEAYKQLMKRGAVSYGDKVDFIVPTGNFGDILAGFYAKALGLPAGRLVVASNENNVLTDFFTTGVYNKKRPFVKTISPSMDILVSSNLERMLYYAADGDCSYVAGLMKDLAEKGSFEVTDAVMEKLDETFDAAYADNEESKRAIRKAWEKDGRLIDPHTAVGYRVAELMEEDRKEAGEAKVPTVILSTASPFKFAKDVYEAIFGPLHENADGFDYMAALAEKTGESIPKPLAELKAKPVLHKSVLEIGEMEQFVIDSLKVLG